jgi:hypothetical protein
VSDNVNHPAHYTQWPVEVINLTERECFLYGNVLKYALRAGSKPGATYEEDMSKAVWYAVRYVDNIAKAGPSDTEDGLSGLRQAADDAIAYLASRQEDTTEMREYLQDQLEVIYGRVNEEVGGAWDAT